jgi:hypothetical protein
VITITGAADTPLIGLPELPPAEVNDRHARLVQIFGTEYGDQLPFEPLKVGGDDMSDLVDGETLGCYFHLASPEKLDKLVNSNIILTTQKGIEGSRMIPTLWGVVRCLVAEGLLARAVLPKVLPDGRVEAVHIVNNGATPKVLAELQAVMKKLPLLHAVVTTAMKFYSGGVNVESDLGNSLSGQE